MVAHKDEGMDFDIPSFDPFVKQVGVDAVAIGKRSVVVFRVVVSCDDVIGVLVC